LYLRESARWLKRASQIWLRSWRDRLARPALRTQ
jgi:hypothetical protein